MTTLKNYSKQQFMNDVIAGTIVAIIALPLSIALAIASGVSPEKGLHTAIIAGFIISMMGGSRVQIGGPTGAFMIIVYGIVIKYGSTGLMIATMMAGLIMILMGFFKLGRVIKFIPFPITTGFTSGIAVVIFTSQIKDFLGLKLSETPVGFIDQWRVYLSSISNINWTTLGIGVLALLIIVFWPKINKKIPGALIALFVTSAIVIIFKLPVETIGTKFGQISSSLPKLQHVSIDFATVVELIGPALTIAVLGSIESLLSAVVSDGMIGGKHRSNMELIAQGTANIFSALFGGIPATGAIARTVANIKNGGRTPVAGMVHAIVLLLIMLLFMPLAKMIPLTALSAVLIIVAYNMSEWREFKALLISPRSDVLVLLVTFGITVIVDLVRAIEVGMVLASFLFMKRMSEVTSAEPITLDAAEELENERYDFESENRGIRLSDKIQIYEINGPFFFGAADKFIEAFRRIGDEKEVLIIRMRNVPAMDATALHAFKTLVQRARYLNLKVYVSGINAQPLTVLKKSGLLDTIGEKHIFNTIGEAINYKLDSDVSKRRSEAI
jgi:SulP family sulfate permease